MGWLNRRRLRKLRKRINYAEAELIAMARHKLEHKKALKKRKLLELRVEHDTLEVIEGHKRRLRALENTNGPAASPAAQPSVKG